MRELMWAIYGRYGLYYGTWRTRADAVEEHVRMKGMSWDECRLRGDAVVRVEVRIMFSPTRAVSQKLPSR